MDNLKEYIQQNLNLIEHNDMPSKNAWTNIKTSINKQEKVVAIKPQAKIILLCKYAVAACVIGLAIVGALHLINNKSQPNNMDTATTQQPKNDIKPNTKNDTPINIVEADTPLAVIETVAKTFIKAVANTVINDDTINALIGNYSNNNSVAFIQVKSIDSQYNQVIDLQKNMISNTPIYAENAAYFKSFSNDFKQMEADEKRIKKDIALLGFKQELLSQLINVYQQKLDLLKMFQTEINKTNIRYKQNRNDIDSSKIYYVAI